MKKIFKIGLFSLLAVVTCGASITFGVKGQNIKLEANADASTFVWTSDAEIANYYSGVTDSMSGTTLLTTLNSINKSKRVRTLGYDALKTKGKLTEIDWATKKPSNQMYGFYDNALIADEWDGQKTWNREHVWPNSLGGGKVEGDLLMVRPASVKINSERGNDFYAKKGGYDPGQYSVEYRGVAARIIFYCAIADTSLKIIDTTSKSSNSMGKLSDLLEWNLTYLPSKSESAALGLRIEQNRNEINYKNTSLQRNRNPFVDHPEYACKIWGNTNETTKSICSGVSFDSISLNQTTASVKAGSSITLTATASDGSKNFTWSSSNTSVATVSNGIVTGIATGNTTITVSTTINGKTYTATCAITVTNGDTPTPPTPAGNGTLENPYKPSQARDPSVLGQAYIKGEAHNINYNGANVTLSLFDVGNVTGQTGINVIDLDASNLKIEDGDIVILKATKGDKNQKWIAPGYIYSVEKKSGGCSGSIITSSIVLFSTALVGLSAVIIRKKKEEK